MSWFANLTANLRKQDALRNYPLLVRQHRVLGDAIANQQREFSRLFALTPRPGPAVEPLRQAINRVDNDHTRVGELFLTAHEELRRVAAEAVRAGRIDANAVRFESTLSGGPLIAIVIIAAAAIVALASMLNAQWVNGYMTLRSRQDALRPQITANARILKQWSDSVIEARQTGAIPPGAPPLVPIADPAQPQSAGVALATSAAPLVAVLAAGLVFLVLKPRRAS